jgi:TRAP-type C4-dicarboxylate transport system substrate-binding protein
VPASPVSIAWGETYQALQQGAAESFAYQREGQAKANQEMIEMWKAAGIKVTLLIPEKRRCGGKPLGTRCRSGFPSSRSTALISTKTSST